MTPAEAQALLTGHHATLTAVAPGLGDAVRVLMAASPPTAMREIVQAEHDHWIKEALKHRRPNGRRSDHGESDLGRARIAKRILIKFDALSATEKAAA